MLGIKKERVTGTGCETVCFVLRYCHQRPHRNCTFKKTAWEQPGGVFPQHIQNLITICLGSCHPDVVKARLQKQKAEKKVQNKGFEKMLQDRCSGRKHRPDPVSLLHAVGWFTLVWIYNRHAENSLKLPYHAYYFSDPRFLVRGMEDTGTYARTSTHTKHRNTSIIHSEAVHSHTQSYIKQFTNLPGFNLAR